MMFLSCACYIQGGESLPDDLVAMTREFNKWCSQHKIRCNIFFCPTGWWGVNKCNNGADHVYFDLLLGPWRHYQPPICAALLLVKPGEFPELRIKAYSSRLLLSFLQFTVSHLINEQHGAGDCVPIGRELLLIHGTLTAICSWFSKVEQANRYLTQQEADDIWDTSLLCLVWLQHVWGHGSCMVAFVYACACSRFKMWHCKIN